MQQDHFTARADATAERPVLLLGLMGFGPMQEQLLRAVAAGASRIAWRLGSFAESDGWWINGARTQMLHDGSLRVGSGTPGGRSMQFKLAGIDRPIAFAEPLAARDFEPACRFELSEPGIRAMLARFERWLLPLASQLCLASELIRHQSKLRRTVYHVCAGGRLLAVVDISGNVGVLPSATPLDFASADWYARPSLAALVPESFASMSLPALMWQYALRSSRDLLPQRYREGLIYYRRPPRVPQGMVKDSHLVLMRELAYGAADFEALQQRTGLVEGRLARDLAALYLVGSITSNCQRARPGSALPHSPETWDTSGSKQHGDLPSRGQAEAYPTSLRTNRAPDGRALRAAR